MCIKIGLLLHEQYGLDPHCLSKRLQILQMTKAYECFVICDLRVIKYEFSAYTVRNFMKCTYVCATQQLIKTTDYKYNLIYPLEQMK